MNECKNYNEEENIDEILKNLTYNIFITLYSELGLDGFIQEYYESYSKIEIDKSAVIVNEIYPLNKNIIEAYSVQIGLRKSKELPSYLDASSIIEKLSSVLEWKNKMNSDKEFLKKIFINCDEYQHHEESITKSFLKDPNCLIFTLNSLLWKGNFSKDILSLNQHKGIIITSRYTMIQICKLIMKRSKEQYDKLVKNEKGINLDIENFKTTSLATFYGVSNINNDDKEKNVSENILGFNYGLNELNRVIHEKKGLKSLLTANDLKNLKQNMKIELEKIKKRLKSNSPIKINESKFDLESFFSENEKKWNRSNINGSQKEEFLGYILTLSIFMNIINKMEFEENTDMDKLKDILSRLNKVYLCLSLAALIAVTQAILNRSQFLRTNLVTLVESTFVYLLLGYYNNKYFYKNKIEDIPIFCQLLVKENKDANNIPRSLSPFTELLNYVDEDFQVIIQLFNKMNEEYEHYSFVRYPDSDLPDELIVEKSNHLFDIARYVVMIILLIIVHYSLFNQFEKSSYNIFKR
ncbi:hypothetical protein BCR36DRAFT_298652 [Piromyces finnis]|uniref:Uncharacterized protein n=1 Tax=Piromyces finnis TaxID=1754191 RepID=A0A1Y1V2C9_9FUNG|nr:hypothetical protein BCR36DRAFT_298652 [Piromyces finnis]|eukprot:ORX45756.1 hypothetical protein BCR36DRAFT_298652 [Piromyces finnis]